MPVFSFKAMDPAGKVVTGTSEAADYAALTATLKQSNLFLMKATVQSPPAAPAPRAAAPASSPSSPGPARRGSVGLKELSFLTGQLAIMMRNAVPAVEALESVARRESQPRLQEAVLDVANRIRKGESLSAAMARQSDVFDDVYVHLIAAGEAQGNVPAVLDRIDGYLTFQAELREKVRSVVIYPLIVISSAVLVVLFVLFFVLPTFVQVFAQFDAPLPAPTRALLAFSAHLQHAWPGYLIALLALGIAAWHEAGKPENKARLDQLLLDLPMIGPLAQSVVLTRLLRTLGTLVRGGIPILKALELTRAAAGNSVFEKLLDEVSQQVSEGKGIAQAFAQSPYVPSAVASMVATAESTGALPEVLDRVSDYYERQSAAAMRDMFTALEPIFVGFLGLVIAGIALCVLLPIFNLGALTQ
jgi:type II secretory pathway component PulF